MSVCIRVPEFGQRVALKIHHYYLTMNDQGQGTCGVGGKHAIGEHRKAGGFSLYQFPVATAINHLKLVAYYNTNFPLSFLEVRSPKWVLQAKTDKRVPLGGSRRQSISLPFPAPRSIPRSWLTSLSITFTAHTLTSAPVVIAPLPNFDPLASLL